MQYTDAALREIAKVLRKHVDRKTLGKIIEELFETRGDKAFRETIQLLAHELGVRF